MLIEVADTTLERDREVKAPAYAVAGIEEYWIVNLAERQLEQHLQPQAGSYQQITRFKLSQTFEHPWLGTVRVQELIP